MWVVKRFNIIGFFLLLINPYLTIPFSLYGIQRRNRQSMVLFAICISLVTYQLVPFQSMDLAMHYRNYYFFNYMNFQEFLIFLFFQSDYIFYSALYLASQINVSAQIVVSICTLVTLTSIFSVLFNVYEKENLQLTQKSYLVFFLLIFISIEFLALYSGIRNLLASSIAFYAFYMGFWSNKRIGLSLLVFSGLVHFSSFVLLPVFFLAFYFKLPKRLINQFFLASLISLVFLNKEVLLLLLDILPLPSLISAKAEYYLTGQDLVQRSIGNSLSEAISFVLRNLWYLIATIYLLIRWRDKSDFRSVVLLFFVLLNIFSLAPDTFQRFAYLGKMLFIILLLIDYSRIKNQIHIQVFSLIFLMTFLVNTIIFRDYFIKSLGTSDGLTTYTILKKKVDVSVYKNAF